MVDSLKHICLTSVIQNSNVKTLYVHLRPNLGFFQSYWDIEIPGLPENIILKKVILPEKASLCGLCLNLKIENGTCMVTHPCGT